MAILTISSKVRDMATSFKQENTKRAPDGRQAWRCACLTNLSQSNAPDAESVLPETAPNLSIVVFLADMDDAAIFVFQFARQSPRQGVVLAAGGYFLARFFVYALISQLLIQGIHVCLGQGQTRFCAMRSSKIQNLTWADIESNAVMKLPKKKSTGQERDETTSSTHELSEGQRVIQ